MPLVILNQFYDDHGLLREIRPCRRCEGSGVDPKDADGPRACYGCSGLGHVTPIKGGA